MQSEIQVHELERQRDELLDLLTRIIDGDTGRNVFWKLSTGQGTETEDGKTWLAAKAAVAAAKRHNAGEKESAHSLRKPE